MKKAVLMITDLEGISGISDIQQVSRTDTPDYLLSRERLMADTNAAIAGALEGGAEEIYVWDGHGGGKNFIPGALDPRAVQIDIHTIGGIIARCGVLMLVGMHAMSGTQAAFLDHTQSSASIFDYRYNGIRRGEIAQECIYAGAFGIPCSLVTGDRAACAEAEALIPGVVTAEVKSAVVRNEALCIGEDEAHERIRQAARQAMAEAGHIRPFTPGFPLTITVTYTRTDYADAAMTQRSDAVRLDARTVERISEKIDSYYDILI